MIFPKSKVAIIILNWNGLKDTLECLRALRKTEYPNFEVIVVDNASTDGSPEKIRNQFPETVLIENEENLGFTGGNNAGIRYAMKTHAEYVWLLNNDTVCEADTLKKLVISAEINPRAGLISPVIYYFGDRCRLQYCGSYFDQINFRIKEFENLQDFEKSKEKEICLWGTALLIKKSVIEKIGYLNDKFFAYNEDAEYSLRALKNGFTSQVEINAKIYHKYHFVDELGIKGFPAHFFYYMTRNRYWLWKDNIRGFRKILFLKKYLAIILVQLGDYKKLNDQKITDACLDGLFCALLNFGGAWNKRLEMPRVIKKIICLHPYFLANLIDLKLKNNLNGVKFLIKKKFCGFKNNPAI